MARFRLLTPDAQYADDGIIERRTAGADVDWDIFRERAPDRLTAEALASSDAMVIWHEMKVDRLLLASLKNLPHQSCVRAWASTTSISMRLPKSAFRSATRRTMARARLPDHAIGLMLALKRGIVSYHQHLSRGHDKGFRLFARCRWSADCAARSSASSGLAVSAWRRRLRARAVRHVRRGIRSALVSRGTGNFGRRRPQGKPRRVAGGQRCRSASIAR